MTGRNLKGTSNPWAVGLYKTIETDSKGRIETATQVTNASDTELRIYTIRGGVEIKGDVLEINGDGLAMADTYTIYDCDGDKTETINESSLNRDYKTGMIGTVAVVLDDGEVVEIYVLDDDSAVPAPGAGQTLTPGTDITDIDTLRPGEVIMGSDSDINNMDNVPNDVAPGNNVVIAFETKTANQKVILEIKEGSSTSKYQEWATFAEAGTHYFYVSLTGLNGMAGDDKTAASGKTGAWEAVSASAAGTSAAASTAHNWTVKVLTNSTDEHGTTTAAEGATLNSGSFTTPA